MKTRHLGFVAAVVSLIVIPIGLAARLPVEKPMPALRGANGWVNSPPLTTWICGEFLDAGAQVFCFTFG